MNNEIQKFRTFAITIRPRNGIDDDAIIVVTEWIRKRCTHYYIVTEKEGSAKHIHAALYLKVSVTRSQILTVLLRLGAKIDLDNDEIAVLRKGLRILYSNDFVENYLSKDDNTEVVASCLPESSTLLSWYPPKPQPLTKKIAARHSKYYWELEALWNLHKRPIEEANTPNIRNFLFNMMYNKRLIPVIKDDKSIIQVAKHLTRWINRKDESTIEIPPFETEE